MKTCQKCFTEVADGVKICPNCGENVPDEKKKKKPQYPFAIETATACGTFKVAEVFVPTLLKAGDVLIYNELGYTRGYLSLFRGVDQIWFWFRNRWVKKIFNFYLGNTALRYDAREEKRKLIEQLPHLLAAWSGLRAQKKPTKKYPYRWILKD